jgi:hypothetical protein
MKAYDWSFVSRNNNDVTYSSRKHFSSDLKGDGAYIVTNEKDYQVHRVGESIFLVKRTTKDGKYLISDTRCFKNKCTTVNKKYCDSVQNLTHSTFFTDDISALKDCKKVLEKISLDTSTLTSDFKEDTKLISDKFGKDIEIFSLNPSAVIESLSTIIEASNSCMNKKFKPSEVIETNKKTGSSALKI